MTDIGPCRRESSQNTAATLDLIGKDHGSRLPRVRESSFPRTIGATLFLRRAKKSFPYAWRLGRHLRRTDNTFVFACEKPRPGFAHSPSQLTWHLPSRATHLP